jgi:hypothetical protein
MYEDTCYCDTTVSLQFPSLRGIDVIQKPDFGTS